MTESVDDRDHGRDTLREPRSEDDRAQDELSTEAPEQRPEDDGPQNEPSTKTPEQLLLDQMFRGDREAIASFIKTYWRVVEGATSPVLAWARPSVPSGAKEDLVQGVWAWLFERDFSPLRGFDPTRGSFTTFLRLKVGARAHALHRKLHGLESVKSDYDDVSDIVASDPNVQLTDVQAREILKKLREELPPLQFRAFYEMKVLGRTAREVAEIYESTEGAVFAACSRATRRAREICKLVDEDGGEQ